MKPPKLSIRLNPLGEAMKLENAFNKLRETDHRNSFDRLESWLDHNQQTPRPMKNIYKIAASFIVVTLILIACSVPVEYEEEIGYMIKGISSQEGSSLVENMKSAKAVFGKQVVMSYIITDRKNQESVHQAEIILILPNADITQANLKKDQLNSLFDFDKVDLLPIEEEVEVPLYEAALSQINLNFGKGIPEEVIVERFNKVLHENSNVAGRAAISTDKDGNKVVEIIIENETSNQEIKEALNRIDPADIKSISVTKDKDGNNVIDMDFKEEEIENQ